MKLVHWVVTLPLVLVAVIFAVSNRDSVIVTFWPLPAILQAPLYLVVLLAVLVGFILGELVAWIGGGRARRERRERGRRIQTLERELADTQARLAQATPLAPTTPPRPRLPPD